MSIKTIQRDTSSSPRTELRNHGLRGTLRSHGLEVGAGHGNVTSAEVAVALVPANVVL